MPVARPAAAPVAALRQLQPSVREQNAAELLAWIVSITLFIVLTVACGIYRNRRRDADTAREMQEARRERNQRLRDAPSTPSYHPGFDPGSLRSFEAKGEERNAPCPICLEPLADRAISAGPCAHALHTTCLSEWLMQDPHFSCPVCRTPHDSRVSVGSDELCSHDGTDENYSTGGTLGTNGDTNTVILVDGVAPAALQCADQASDDGVPTTISTISSIQEAAVDQAVPDNTIVEPTEPPPIANFSLS